MFTFLSSAPKDLLRVRITSGTTAKPVDGPARSVAKGEELDVTRDVADALFSAGRAIVLGKVDGAGGLSPLPVRNQKPREKSFEAEPVPENYVNLPAVFAETWKLREERRRLAFEVTAAEKAVVNAGPEDSSLRGLNERLFAAREAHQDARRQESFERALVACGRHTISEIRSLNALRDALATTAFDIFKSRLAALELAESKARNLFAGSVLALRYVFPRMPESGMRRAGDFSYMDAPLESQASTIFSMRSRRDELTAKLEEAKAELAAASGSTTKHAKRAA